MELTRRDLLQASGAAVTLSLIPRWLLGKVTPIAAAGEGSTGQVVILSKLNFARAMVTRSGQSGQGCYMSVPITREMLALPDIDQLIAGRLADTISLLRLFSIRPDAAPPLESITFRALYGLSGIPVDEVSRLNMRSVAMEPEFRRAIAPLRLQSHKTRRARQCPSCGDMIWPDTRRCPTCNVRVLDAA